MSSSEGGGLSWGSEARSLRRRGGFAEEKTKEDFSVRLAKNCCKNGGFSVDMEKKGKGGDQNPKGSGSRSTREGKKRELRRWQRKRVRGRQRLVLGVVMGPEHLGGGKGTKLTATK